VENIIDTIKEAIKSRVYNLFYVHVPANVYAGKWYDYRSLKVPVLAVDEDHAIALVNDSKLNVLGWAKARRVNGRRLIQAKVPADKSVFFKERYYVKAEDVFGRIGPALCADGRFYRIETQPIKVHVKPA